MAVDTRHIGQLVVDVDGRRGILMAIDPKWANPAEMPARRAERRTAFVRPIGGGIEWMTAPSALFPAAEATR
jgi:hypothetical protein